MKRFKCRNNCKCSLIVSIRSRTQISKTPIPKYSQQVNQGSIVISENFALPNTSYSKKKAKPRNQEPTKCKKRR